MRIRLATPDDASAISRLVCPLIARFIAHEYSTEGRQTLLSCFTADAIEGYLRGGYRFHVAEADGQIVGSVGVRDDRHLFNLFVGEPYQRQGVARALWDTAKTAAEPGNAGAGFTVNSSRFAVPIYRSLGFVETGPPEERSGVVSVPMRFEG